MLSIPPLFIDYHHPVNSEKTGNWVKSSPSPLAIAIFSNNSCPYQKRTDFPGIPPDYDQVIFSPYLEPMFKVKSKNEATLQKLETLLTNGKYFNKLPY